MMLYLFFALWMLVPSAFAVDESQFKAFLQPDSSFSKATKVVWGVQVRTADELSCLDAQFFEVLRRSGLQNIDTLLHLIGSTGIELASQPLNRMTSLDPVDVLKLYQAEVRSMPQYLSFDFGVLVNYLKLTPAQAKIVSFDRRLLKFRWATKIEPPFVTPMDQETLRLASPTGYTSLLRATQMKWGFVIPTLQALACLTQDELKSLPQFGQKRRAEFGAAIDNHRNRYGQSELAEFKSLRGVDRVVLYLAGVQTREMYLSPILDNELKALLDVSTEQWEAIETERERARQLQTCSNQVL